MESKGGLTVKHGSRWQLGRMGEWESGNETQGNFGFAGRVSHTHTHADKIGTQSERFTAHTHTHTDDEHTTRRK